MAQNLLNQLKRISTYENWAANNIQKNWRAFKHKQSFERLKESTINFQAYCRGFLLRGKVNTTEMKKERDQKERQRLRQLSEHSIQSMPETLISVDTRSVHSDETFLSKGSSQEELLEQYVRQVSEELISQSTTVPTVEPSVALKISEYEDSPTINEDMDESDRERDRDRGRQLFDFDNDESFMVQSDDMSRHLDRRRNRVVRKLSLKKSKSNKTLVSEVKSHDLSPTKAQHKPLTKMTSDSSALI